MKIFKLLVNELNQLDETILFDDESDASDDDLNNETDTNQQNGNSPPKVFHASDLWYDDDEDEDEDQLLKELEQDPIFQTNLKETLIKFLQNFATTDNFAEYAQHLSDDEKMVLRRIQVNV